jgi:hypothetical protein
MKPEELEVHQDQGSAKRCAQKQIASSTPTAEMVENNPKKFPKNKKT